VSLHAYFAERETLQDVFPDWPDRMGAAVLLEESEGHHIALYHLEEAERLLGRLCARTGLSPEEIVIVSPEGQGPSGEGHPRVRIRFSEDREILDLLGHTRDLAERARDYRLNFEYVRDQGLGTGLDADLNPITPDGEERLVFTPLPTRAQRKSATGWRSEAGLEGEDEDAPEDGAVDGAMDRFRPVEGGDEDLICYDVPAIPDQVGAYRILTGDMRVRGGVVQLRPAGSRFRSEEVRPGQLLGFRDDLSDVLLPADLFEAPPESAGLCVELERGAFPEGFLGYGGASPRQVRIAVTPWGARVRPTPGLTGLILPWLGRNTMLGFLAVLLLSLLLSLIFPSLSGSQDPLVPVDPGQTETDLRD
jgi:hypothetical protein